MDDGAIGGGVCIHASAAGQDIAAAVRAAGWRADAPDPLVLLVDARDDPARVAACDGEALASRRALLAIGAGPAAVDRAYEHGATHVLTGDPTPMALATALRFAERHARRLRGIGRSRRLEDAPDGIARLVAALPAASPLTVAIVALTQFDVVNQAFGRAVGDELITAAIARVLAVLPPTAMVERADGARIHVALAAPRTEADELLAAIDRALAASFPIDGRDANLGARIGAAHGATGEGAIGVWRRASDALDAARRGSGARLHLAAAPDPTAPVLRLAADLHRAIDRSEIDILFQPQAALADDSIVGVEALARWEHPEHGVLGAETLFDAAARADLGLALSEHIQSIALARAAAWPSALAGLRVALNVIAEEVVRPDFAARFLDRVSARNIDPTRVTAELTETAMLADRFAAATQLGALRDAGVRVAADDFGTGYSSLAYLKDLPLDYIKIDRRLTRDIAGAPRDAIVVRGVIAIADALGIETIAEGVETVEQRAALAGTGCRYYQGFLRAGPGDDAALGRLMEER